MEKSFAFNRGFRDYLNQDAHPKKDNPYPYPSVDHHDWRKGFIAGMEYDPFNGEES